MPTEQTITLNDFYRRMGEYDKQVTQLMNAELQFLSAVMKTVNNPYVTGLAKGKIWTLQRRSLNKQCYTYYSAEGQDKFIIEELLNKKQNGVFLEIGGYDGLTASNCLHLEAHCNWTGVIVEPIPEYAELIRSKRSSKVECAAVADKDGEAEILFIEGGYTQMSFLVDQVDNKDINRMRQHSEHKEKKVSVKTLTMNSLLEKYDLKDVDYCSIDVEGAEYLALQNFDFDKYNVGIFSIENRGMKENDVVKLLREKGYRLMNILGHDEIWQKQ